MLSVSQAAERLDVSPSRVRKMISDKVLKAEKVGNSWIIAENEVSRRLSTRPKAGRPRVKNTSINNKVECINLHEIYTKLKNTNFVRPSAATIAMMQDKDEAGFLLCVCDYFLNLKQRKEIEEGVY